MRKIVHAVLAAGLLTCASNATARPIDDPTGSATDPVGQVAIRNVKVAAKDVLKTAAFYQAVFGLKETMRIKRTDLLEVVMNFGETVEAAKANPGTRFLVLNLGSESLPDPVAHVVFTVRNLEEMMKRVTDNGGTIEWGPRESTINIGRLAMVRDPEGNRLEFVESVRVKRK